ncbi:MAG: hypothetical protein P9M14_12795 [Candidatus Alcyoniella australis]|nr:hypothetical protein [Candidatus Alcyoniella australis]
MAGACEKDPIQRLENIEETYISHLQRQSEELSRCSKARELSEKTCWGKSQRPFRDYQQGFFSALRQMQQDLPNGYDHSEDCYETCIRNSGFTGDLIYNPVFLKGSNEDRGLELAGMPGCFQMCRSYLVAANGIE